MALSISNITVTATKAVPWLDIVGKLCTLCEEGLGSVRESVGCKVFDDPKRERSPYENFVKVLKEVFGRGEELEGVIWRLVTLKRDNSTLSMWLVFPCSVNEGGPREKLLNICDMPSGICKELAQYAGVDDFNVVSDESRCGRAIIASAGERGKVVDMEMGVVV